MPLTDWSTDVFMWTDVSAPSAHKEVVSVRSQNAAETLEESSNRGVFKKQNRYYNEEYFYTSAHSTLDKENESRVMVQQKSCSTSF